MKTPLRSIAVLLFLALASLACTAHAQDKQEKSLLDRGRELALLNRHQEAVLVYTKAIDANLNPGLAYLGRASSEMALGNLPQAINDCDAAIAILPGYAEAYLTRAMAYAADGNSQPALSDYDKAVALAPGNAYALYNRGVLYTRLGRYEEAKKDYAAAAEADPGLASAWFGKGLALYALGENAEAVSAYSRTTELDPDFTDAYNNRGLAYKRMGEYLQAAEDFSRVIARNPDDAVALVNRGQARRSAKDYKGALGDFHEALRIDPGLWIAYNGYAWLLATCPDPAFVHGRKAVDLAQEAVSLHKSAFSLDTLAAAYARAERYRDAVSCQERAIEYREKIEGKKVPAGFVLRLERYKELKPWVEE